MKNGVLVTITIDSNNHQIVNEWLRKHVDDNSLLGWCNNIRKFVKGDTLCVLYHSTKVGIANACPILYGLYKDIKNSSSNIKVEEMSESNYITLDGEEHVPIEKMKIIMRNATLFA